MKYKLKFPLVLDGVRREAGAELDLTEDQAAAYGEDYLEALDKKESKTETEAPKKGRKAK